MVRTAMTLAVGGNASVMAAAATVAEDASSAAAWVQGGGSAAAVAGLVYFARLIARGEMVPRPVKETEAELTSAIRAAGEREARLMQVVEEQRQHQHELRGTLQSVMNQTNDVVRTSTLCQESIRQATEEMRYWRERRDSR